MKNLTFTTLFLFLNLLGLAQRPQQVLDLVPGTASTFTDANDRILGVAGGTRIVLDVPQR
jgi:hypothetical protein